MGIIQKQTIKGSIFSYLGVLLGFMITGLLAPRILSTDENGLIKLLVSYSVILAQFASLGFNSVTTRLFPYFRNKEKKHNGYIFLAVAVTLTGLIFAFLIYFIFKYSFFYQSGGDENALLQTYINYILFLIIFHAFFYLFDNYAKVLYNAVIGTFVKEVLQRILILAIFILYYLEIIDLSSFVLYYVICYAIPPAYLLIYLLIKKEFSLVPRFEILSGKFRAEIADVALFGLIVGFTNMLILNIDSIMINRLIDLENTGIYSITFFFGTLVIIPSRAIKKIAAPVLADAWKVNDIKTVREVYNRSTINLFAYGLLIFIGIWANIDNVFEILPEEYLPGKYVILFISLANLFEMAAGVTTTILNTSKYYRYMTWFMFVLVVLLVGTNFIFIPIMGITGAAVASVISFFVFILLRYILIYRKYKLQPYNYKFLIILVIGILIYYLSTFIPNIKPFYVDIILRSLLISIGYLFLVIISNVNPDIKEMVITIITRNGK